MSRKRLSKKQLKGDRFVEQTFDWAHWVENHRREVLGGLAAVALIVAGVFVYRGVSTSAEESASGEYLEARQAYFAGNFPLAASDLQDFIREHGDTSYGDDARFFRADALYQAGDIEGAVQALEEFMDRHTGSPFAGTARMMLAASYARVQRFDEAEAQYQEALEHAAYDSERIEVLEELARLYEMRGNRTAAVDQYRTIADLTTDDAVASRAERRIAELSVEPIVTGGTSEEGS